MKSIDDLKKAIQNEQEKNKGHFEAGRQFHSEKYVNLKVYFHNVQTVAVLCDALAQRIQEINPKNEPTTFIGFRGYCGTLLSMICKKLDSCNYYIVETEDNKVVWQSKPEDDDVKENVIIVLPVSCTSSNVFNVRSFLETSEANSIFNNRISNNFINIFTIFHEGFEEPIPYNQEQIKAHYQLFNWSRLDEKKTITIHKNDCDQTGLGDLRL